MPGGLKGYSPERIHEEVAFIAYHFHWAYEDIMNFSHSERNKWCEEISKINRKLSEETNTNDQLFKA